MHQVSFILLDVSFPYLSSLINMKASHFSHQHRYRVGPEPRGTREGGMLFRRKRTLYFPVVMRILSLMLSAL